MLSTATRPFAFDASRDFHGLIHSSATSPGSVPLKLVEHVKSSLPQKEEPDRDVPSSKRQRRRIGDKGVMEFMQSFRKERALDSKPVPQSDGKQAVVNNIASNTSNHTEEKKCGTSLSSHQPLRSHISSSQYVRETNDLKEGNHECKVCHKRFNSGQALGGHKRVHYEGPPIVTKRKAPSFTVSLMPSSQENSPSPAGCMKLFRDEPSQFRDTQANSQSLAGCNNLLERDGLNPLTEINLDLTL